MIRIKYLDTVFLPKEPVPSRWPDAFAVITACNPRGQDAHPDANRKSSALLRKATGRLKLKRHRVTGMSDDMKHREPGFAIWGCDLSAALELGSQFNQDAIFWVEDGRLDVVSCATGERQHVALWAQRLRSRGQRSKCCRVYVIELADKARTVGKVKKANPHANPKMKCLYVGSTARTPGERFKIHKTQGKQSSAIVREYGLRLVPALYRDLPLMTRISAERREAQLAAKLRGKGYTVWQK
jgi:hypothetical protein